MTEIDRRPVSCRAKHCTNSGPMNEYVRASTVLGRENARGWFCPGCAENGGTRVFKPRTTLAEAFSDLDLVTLCNTAPCFGLSNFERFKEAQWLTCTTHPECAALVAFCEAKHERYGEALFPR